MINLTSEQIAENRKQIERSAAVADNVESLINACMIANDSDSATLAAIDAISEVLFHYADTEGKLSATTLNTILFAAGDNIRRAARRAKQRQHNIAA